ncbi:MAG: carboxypeptidase-like regulatory domain-containing protein [Reichenbachiella sp.]
MAQDLTRIFGSIVDEISGEPLPYVNISFEGTAIGTVSDVDGKFYIETTEATSRLKVSFIGYESKFHPIKIGQTQTVSVALLESSIQLDAIVVSSKKLRYRNKNNPAVSIIKKIIDHKESNRPQSLDYFEYDKYDKVEFDLNNITQKFKDKKSMKNFQLIFDYVDTSEVNGQTYLPIFLRETSSKVYYRKSPQKTIEYRKGQKMTGFEEYFDNEGISSMIDKMYQDIDIYDNSINILTQKFTSPISSIGPMTYKYYVADTLEIDSVKYFKVAFQPRNENNLAFVGNMLITTDSSFAVKKVSMRLSQKINLNFVEDLYVDQEFEKNEFGTYDLITDKISIDFELVNKNGMGVFGKRTVSYRDMVYNKPQQNEMYSGLTNLVIDPNLENQPDEFWEQARHMDLSRSEQGVFTMIEQVKEIPAFKRMMDLIMLIFVGYIDLGPVEIGPINTFVSWNDIEGFRTRFGGRTTDEFSEKFLIDAYGAYGFNDEEFKYSGTLTHFFNTKPLTAIRGSYQQEIRNPGQQLQFWMEDNFFLSFRRGVNDKRFYKNKAEFELLKDLNHGLSFNASAKYVETEPAGVLSFLPGENIRDPDDGFITREERELQTITTSETSLTVRFAPNEQYYKGKKYRIPIPNKHPVFTIIYDHGFDDLLGSDYGYNRLSLGIYKRSFFSPIGYLDAEMEARKLWGKVPYPLLNIPNANQTYSYQVRAYNLMNYLEFVSDEYVSLRLAHHFNGFIMNKVPILKKMKLRSIITMKALYGRLTELNDPSFDQNSDLPDLPSNPDGTQATYPLDFYLESSIGVGNIFNIFRIDLVKRWTDVDRTDVSANINVRATFKIEF